MPLYESVCEEDGSVVELMRPMARSVAPLRPPMKRTALLAAAAVLALPSCDSGTQSEGEAPTPAVVGGERAPGPAPVVNGSEAMRPAERGAPSVADVWPGLMSHDDEALAVSIKVLLGIDPESLRAAEYRVVMIDEREALSTEGIQFELPGSEVREWAGRLQEQLATRDPEIRARAFIQLDALFAGIMESWPSLRDSWRRLNMDNDVVELYGVPLPYTLTVSLRMWINDELAKLGEAAAAYQPLERRKLLKRIGQSGSFYMQEPIP